MIQLLIGSYSEGRPDGVRLVDFDLATGSLSLAAVLEGAPDASFVAYDRGKLRLYVTDEMAGRVGAFALTADARELTPLGYLPSEAELPCYLSLSPDRTHLACANYGADLVSVFAIDAEGALHAGPQILHGTQAPSDGHAHWAQWSPEGDRLYAVDLGHNEVRSWNYETATGKLLGPPQTAFAAPPKAGPRHLAFHPDGRFAYLFTEYSNTITALKRQADGSLRELHTLPSVPADFGETSYGAHIEISADGEVVYVSNRGHNSIASYRIAGDGWLTPLQAISCGGHWPRFFLLVGQHLIVANQQSDNLVVFSVAADGRLNPTGRTLAIPNPVMILAL
jgi:6-phosphogluconolactonase